MEEQITGQADFEIQAPGIENVGKTEVISSQATVLMSLEEMIKRYIERLDVLKVEIKKHKDMHDDAFLNNPTYIENYQKAKEAGKDLLTTKKNISSQPAQVQLNLKIKNMRDEMKEMKMSLSDYLQEYSRMTGATQLELFDGSMMDIVLTAKAVRRSARG